MSEPTFLSKINLYSEYRIHEESHYQLLTFLIGYFCKERYFLSREYIIFIRNMK